MDIIRRNTDYALRAMVHLACCHGSGPESTRTIATEENVSYQLCCKLMQRLNKAGLVQSCMGVKGGFELSRDPAQINLLEIIETIQGPLSVNRCVLGRNVCKNQSTCPVCVKLGELQGDMTSYLTNTSLQDIIDLAD
jgi:Rrf2 family iron-sulfur cluster assembly transcriptional regulator